MTEPLSDYELKRLATIKANAEILKSLGLEHAVKAVRPAAPPKKPKQPKQTAEVTNVRSSRRLSGEPVVGAESLDDSAFDEAPEYAYRDPNDVSEMNPTELKAWCQGIVESLLPSVMEGLDEAQQQRVRKAVDEWFGPFAEFTARFGGKNESPISRANLRSCLKTVLMLVSGAGVRSNKREGAFAEGRPISLGITAAQVNALRAEAQLWMPLKASPFDLIGMVVNGVTVPKTPVSGPLDLSNGWFLNHPLMKVRLYCEHLDEVAETSFEATMRRLTGGDAPAESESLAMAVPSKMAAVVPFEDFVVADGEGEEVEGAGRAKPKRPTPKAKAKAKPPPAEEQGKEHEEEDDDEDAPLRKRIKARATTS